MKAFLIDDYRSEGRVAEVAEPEVGDRDVLVALRAASVNPLDNKIRDGDFRRILKYRLPLVLGNDGAGTVVKIGNKVTRFLPGDEVYTRPDQERIGTFAQRIAVKESALAKKPSNLSMVEADSLPLTALTAWQALVETAGLQAGQKVFIHAGSGGVGSVAIPLAKHLGAYVATTTSARNRDWVKALGADLVIDYHSQDFASELREYDVVLNSLGPEILSRSVQVLAKGGHQLSLSGPPTPEFAQSQGLPWIVRALLSLASFKIRRAVRAKGARYSFVFMRADGRQLEEISRLVESQVLRPTVERVFPLERAQEALDYVAAGRTRGKVVIEIPD